MIRLGITGTDTGVGKTFVGCVLAAGFRRAGLDVVAMKPVETGVAADDATRDGARLARAAGARAPMSLTAPIVLPDPLAPLAAARNVERAIDVADLDDAVRQASAGADVLVVEGAGGLLVPVTEDHAFDTLFARWCLELIIVAANKLGVINQTRLTIREARRAGLFVRAVVLNATTPALDSSTRDNARLIAELEEVPVLELPWTADVDDVEPAFELLRPHVLAELELARR